MSSLRSSLSPRAYLSGKAEKLKLRIAQRQQTAEPSRRWPDHHLAGPDGEPLPFHRAQRLAFDSPRRYVAMIAGTQGGKTSFGPWWLDDRIRQRGGGDYLAVTASYDLFKLKMLPEFLRVFEDILKRGRFWLGDKIFELRDPATGQFWAKKSTDRMWGRVILRSAQSLGGLESATVKGMWLDEAGQDDFTLDAWRALRRRGAIHRAAVLITTTLYNLGWLKQQIIDKAVAGGLVQIERPTPASEIEFTDNAAANIALVQYDSIVNPAYPKEEYDEAQATTPDDEFQMFWRGRVTSLRTLIYDCFDRKRHTCKPFKLPPEWKRYLGMDFGGVNTAGIFYAQEPGSGNLYGYREYLAGKRTAAEHAEELQKGEPMLPFCVGGSKSEGQWRDEFRAAGLPVREPQIVDVNVGINRVYGMHKQGKIIYFDTLEGVLDQKGSYKRKRDKTGEVTDEIENKNAYHFMDAERYIIGHLNDKADKLKAQENPFYG